MTLSMMSFLRSHSNTHFLSRKSILYCSRYIFELQDYNNCTYKSIADHFHITNVLLLMQYYGKCTYDSIATRSFFSITYYTIPSSKHRNKEGKL